MPTVQENGIGIYYEVQGEGDPLLLIGGLAIDLTQMKDIVGGLSKRQKVIAFDNRGVGRTDKPDTPYTIDIMAEDAAGLLKAVGDYPAHVLGISMGGRIALALALGHPELVKSLILASTSASTSRRRGARWWLSNQLLRIGWVRAVGTKYPQPYFAYVRQRDASKGFDASSRLGEISKPTLILYGRKDSMVPYSLAEAMHRGIGGSRLVAFDGGHIFMFRKPKEFVASVEGFIGSQA